MVNTTERIFQSDDEFPSYVSTTVFPSSNIENERVCRFNHIWETSWEYIRPSLLATPCERSTDGLWILNVEVESQKRKKAR